MHEINYTEKDLEAEVTTIIEHALAKHQPVLANWITHEVIKSWEPIPEIMTQADRYLHCAFGHVRSTVRRLVQRYKPSDDTIDPQMILPGYERLQIAYLVQRDKQQMLVAVADLTDEEIEAKCAELKAMANGCLRHVKELERYLVERRSATAL